MSAQQMICHLSDSFRAALGEKQISQSTTVFKRTIYKWAAPPGFLFSEGGASPLRFFRMARVRLNFDFQCRRIPV
jgi:hypothetical protein